MMTIGEALAIAPGVRKNVKELTMTKRITLTNMIETPETDFFSFFVSDHSCLGGILVAGHAADLRALDPTINDNFSCEFVLDQGSQVIAMQRDI